MSKHVHAELMQQYADDAIISETPWQFWQWTDKYYNGTWNDLSDHPVWDISTQYRRKLKTILINGYEIPEPERKPLESGTKYYIPSISYRRTSYSWENDGVDRLYLTNGMIHLNEEAAILHSKALQSFTKSE